MNHQEMRDLLAEAFARRFGRQASTSELQCAQAVALIETGYGNGWKEPGKRSYNFGAQQAGSGWTGETFVYTDTHPNKDGTSTPYQVKFRKYPTPIAGAEDFISVVYVNKGRGEAVLANATAGRTAMVSAGLYDTGYYEGFGKDGPDPGDSPREERIANHHKAIVGAIRKIAAAFREDLPADIPDTIPSPSTAPLMPTLRKGSDGSAVKVLQVALVRKGYDLKQDGDFGPRTEAAVKAYQLKEGLKPDGVVGPLTWGKLYE